MVLPTNHELVNQLPHEHHSSLDQTFARHRSSDDQANVRDGPSKDGSRRHSIGSSTKIYKTGLVADKVDKNSKSQAERKLRKEILSKVNEERQQRLQLRRNLFGEKWLDECYDKVVYPNPQCAQVSMKLV